jgi:hypothetical protein
MPTTISQIKFPKMYIKGGQGNIADTNSSSQLLTNSGGIGISILNMGPQSVICGPSGFCANVNSSGDLQTTNG